MQAAVRGYEEEFKGRVKVELYSIETPEGEAGTARYKLGSHGIAVTKADGELIFTQRWHLVNPTEIHTWLVFKLNRDGGT